MSKLDGIKQWMPGTPQYSVKHHIKYLQKKARGHDVLLLIEWSDGQLTEMPADYHADKDGWYVTPPGLMFANVGEGVDPMNYHGVPTVRCHAEIACPISTTAAIQAEYDEEDKYEYEVHEDSDGKTQRVIQIEPLESHKADSGETNGSVGNGTDTPVSPDSPGELGDTDGEDDPLATDGGHARKKEVRQYDIRPPSPAVGHAFGLDEVKQRAPNPVTSNLVRRAYEHGKEKGRDDGKVLRVAAAALGIGLALALAVVGFIWLLNQLGGSGSGGGGGISLSLLLLLTGPSRRALLERTTDLLTGPGDE